ncbi:MAG: twitching motility protein [Chloroflexi bacterium]|nr:twitching motility protein [Chloroflexota bacterium]
MASNLLAELNIKELDIHEILKLAAERHASDVHIKAGVSPAFRIHRKLKVVTDLPVCTGDDTAKFLEEITSREQRDTFYRDQELDFAYEDPGISRFRVNAYFQTGTVSLVLRLVRTDVPTVEGLGLPSVCKDLVMKKDGLLILTGPTGCGKSTTMAAMLSYLNTQQERNVITIEDPIEYMFHDDKCTFSQREVGVDTQCFASGLKHVLRQDPDVILIGEMRDLETMATALTAAETGHLVMTTLHTPSTFQAIDRFIDAFPASQHAQIRLQFSTVLLGILYQNLIPAASGTGVVPAVEVLVATPAIRNLIRDGKSFQISTYLHSGQSMGMQTLDQSLVDLHRRGLISYQDAVRHAQNADSIGPKES